MRDTVAIIGSHPRTREDFDFNRTDADIWMFNEVISNKDNTWAKRADAIFQMHIPTIWKNPKNRNDPHHFNWLQTQTEVPTIYMQDVYPEVPASVKYPLSDILRMVDDKDHFLSSSVPQAIALAVHLGYKRIEVYGVAMETNTEYQFQREGVAFWRGFAKGRGIDFYFADPTFEAPLYGYEGEVALHYDEFVKRIDELKPHVQGTEGTYKAKHLDLKKAVEDYASDCSKEHETKLFHVVDQARESVMTLGKLDGAIQANEWYKSKADVMKQASGDFIFSRQEFEAGASTASKKLQDINTAFIAAGVTLTNVHNALKQSAKNSPKRGQMTAAYKMTLDKYLQICNELSVLKGVYEENIRYMQRLDKGIRAAGGAKSEEVIINEMVSASPS